MKLLIQRVSESSVICENGHKASIGKGYLILAGFSVNDSEDMIRKAVQKTINMRLFEDESHKMNRGILDIGGSIMLISQFTLYSNTDKGRRPSFEKSMNRKQSQVLFDLLYNEFSRFIDTQKGVFGDYMKVSLINDGPVTIMTEF